MIRHQWSQKRIIKSISTNKSRLNLRICFFKSISTNKSRLNLRIIKLKIILKQNKLYRDSIRKKKISFQLVQTFKVGLHHPNIGKMKILTKIIKMNTIRKILRFMAKNTAPKSNMKKTYLNLLKS